MSSGGGRQRRESAHGETERSDRAGIDTRMGGVQSAAHDRADRADSADSARALRDRHHRWRGGWRQHCLPPRPAWPDRRARGGTSQADPRQYLARRGAGRSTAQQQRTDPADAHQRRDLPHPRGPDRPGHRLARGRRAAGGVQSAAVGGAATRRHPGHELRIRPAPGRPGRGGTPLPVGEPGRRPRRDVDAVRWVRRSDPADSGVHRRRPREGRARRPGLPCRGDREAGTPRARGGHRAGPDRV